MAIQGAAILVLTVGLASLLYYIFAANGTQEEAYGYENSRGANGSDFERFPNYYNHEASSSDQSSNNNYYYKLIDNPIAERERKIKQFEHFSFLRVQKLYLFLAGNKFDVEEDDRKYCRMITPSALFVYKKFQISAKHFRVIIRFMTNVLKHGDCKVQWDHVILVLCAGSLLKISSFING
ncbi:hypothetical protein M0802_007173 [Mischocyttarus mexicanus]|nr:hypothetical protein M0802_007173 [Mischocyttarus mexicanus]